MAVSTKQIEGEEAMHYVSARKKRTPAKVKMQPPLTPMIDVTFQLLLFVLLACEFRESEGLIPGSLPVGSLSVPIDKQDPPPDPIQIKIRASYDRKSANYEMTGVAVMIVSPEDLYQYLLRRQQQLGTTDVPIVILPNQEAPWEFVVEAFNQAVRAKFTKIAFARQVF